MDFNVYTVKKYVYKVKNNVVKKTPIIIGKSFENQIEVLSGLKNGDLVVIKGNENLRNNQQVRVKKNNFRKKIN